jgi:glycosyltransferase involved in cell wall biosynthesis
MKISCIITVLNEEKTIEHLLTSLVEQSHVPDEIIIVDGGSTDKTIEIIKNFKLPQLQIPVHLKGLQKVGNRSVGRNEAITQATGDIIVCTDAGCFPEKHWVEQITQPFTDPAVDVVAGYYESKTETVFQECLAPYVFVMPDKLNSLTFLPASRSMAFKKSVWEKAGKFPEKYSHNEDYVFARTLRKMNFRIVFRKEAIVYWIPRKTFKEAFIMFYRFAYGDMESSMFRPKVGLVFLRYLYGFAVFCLAVYLQSFPLFIFCLLQLLGYMVWAVWKSYRYIDKVAAIYILPEIQFTADAAVMLGSVRGILARLWGIGKMS